MAKPAYIQRLEKGKLLNGSNFPEFVNTWNFTVEKLENLKGDRDVDPQGGHISVDSSNPEHPVIRFHKEQEKSETVGGVVSLVGDGESSETVDGEVELKGAEGSGLTVVTTPTEEGSNGTASIDIADRESEDEYGTREVTMNDEVVAKVFGTTDFEISQKVIEAGEGIRVEEKDNVITISTDCATPTVGYSGCLNVVVDVDYLNYQLRKKFAVQEWKDGVLVSVEEKDWEVYHTAVEETV